jgi:hypothetical protein
MNITYPAPLDFSRLHNNLCMNDAGKYFTIPPTADKQFRYVHQSLCQILANPALLANEIYRFFGIDIVMVWQNVSIEYRWWQLFNIFKDRGFF